MEKRMPLGIKLLIALAVVCSILTMLFPADQRPSIGSQSGALIDPPLPGFIQR